jgi:hypothetical protein
MAPACAKFRASMIQGGDMTSETYLRQFEGKDEYPLVANIILMLKNYASLQNKTSDNLNPTDQITSDLILSLRNEHVYGISRQLTAEEFYGVRTGLLAGGVEKYKNWDQELILELIREEMKILKLEDKAPSEEEMKRLKENVMSRLESLIEESEKTANEFNSILNSSESIKNIQDELKNILEEATKSQKKDISQSLDDLKAKFLKKDSSETTEQMVIEEWLSFTLPKLWKRLNKSDFKDIRSNTINRLINDSLDQAKSMPLNVKVNFPERARNYSELILCLIDPFQ